MIRTLFRNIIDSLKRFGRYPLILMSLLFILRMVEFLYLKRHIGPGFSFISFEFQGVLYDFLFVSIFSVFLYLLFLISFHFFHKAKEILMASLIALVVIVEWMLTEYLQQMAVPLDHALFVYSIKDILMITKESVEISFMQIFPLVFFPIMIFWIIKKFAKKTYGLEIIISIVFLFSSLTYYSIRNPKPYRYKNDMDYYLAINKISYLGEKSYYHFQDKKMVVNADIPNAINEYHLANPHYDFISKRYPLLRITDTSDVLGPNFLFQEEPPSFVFIIVESLSRAFCGPNSYYGSFTPVLDSIIQHSLYWENFLSTSERTFLALPSIFGSLPYADEGFMELVDWDAAPPHHTLIKTLIDEGYSSRFFYGGWLGFDNMEKFLHYQDVEYQLNSFGDQYNIIEENKEGFSWGYPDKAVFERSMEVIDSFPGYPSLDIYLTISMHHPFKVPDVDYYLEKFEERMTEIALSDQDKEQRRIHQDIFSTIMYTDESIGWLMGEFKKRENFENTIFIITGDHRIGISQPQNKIDKYHVPLIIYSPLLKKAKKISSVSSLANITPSISAMLKKNFNINIPEQVAWIGQQLDTASYFRNIHDIPFMRTNREISEYISGEYFISDEQVYKLTPNMGLERIDDVSLKDSLYNKLNTFKIINQYVCNEKLIIPEY